MREMVDISTSTHARVACAAAIKTKKAEKIARKVMTGQIEGYYLGDKVQRTICHIQSNEQPHIQVGVTEETNNPKEEYLQLHFIPSLQS